MSSFGFSFNVPVLLKAICRYRRTMVRMSYHRAMFPFAQLSRMIFSVHLAGCPASRGFREVGTTDELF
jgi:hypothetical protein